MNVKLSLHTLWDHVVGLEEQFYPFLTSTPDGPERSNSHAPALTCKKNARYPFNRIADNPQSQYRRFVKQKTPCP